MQDPLVFVVINACFITSIVVAPKVARAWEGEDESLVSSMDPWARCAREIIPPCPDEAVVVLRDSAEGAADEIFELLAVSGRHDSFMR
jgi:hypothetical protein